LGAGLDSEADADSEALVDLDCLTDLMADCDAGSDSACDEIISDPAPCKKSTLTSQPSFKAPIVNKPQASPTAVPTPKNSKKPQFSHSQKKQLDKIDGDAMPYQGNHVAKIALRPVKTPTPKAMTPTVVTPKAAAVTPHIGGSATLPSPLKAAIMGKIKEAMAKKEQQQKAPQPPNLVQKVEAPACSLVGKGCPAKKPSASDVMSKIASIR